MNTVLAAPPAVHSIPTDSDGYLRPDLIPVAAYLCSEEYSDRARARLLNRLADGVTPRDCCRDGALDWRDLLDVESLMPVRPSPAEIDLAAVVSGPSPDFEPEFRTVEEWRYLDDLAIHEAACDAHDAEMARIEESSEVTLTFPDWIALQAAALRSHGTEAAGWLADAIDLMAARARFVGASTPAEYDERVEILESSI
jgi:hypothetical protein